ncbi:hypothetical protein NA78x_002773 [Anatilimnocola sp. NA78]|uniref:hypothetical protein n=1 Tax=Anatilimnocola sp. NA78 TaxID=3415683 RepID=UPI003CE47A8C
MGENEQKSDQLPPNLVNEIREGRKFTLAEAIGRLAGPGAMKGVSPATGKQQAEAVIERYLERHLNSPAGALPAVLFRQVRESVLLLNNLDQPLVVLASFVQRVLDSDYLLQELVRAVDCEWGRVYGERPYFEKPGCPPDQEDPYTAESVRNSLSQLVTNLTATSRPDKSI